MTGQAPRTELPPPGRADLDVVVLGAVLRDLSPPPLGGELAGLRVRVRGDRLRASYVQSVHLGPQWRLRARLVPDQRGVRVRGRFDQSWRWLLFGALGLTTLLVGTGTVAVLLDDDGPGILLGVVVVGLAGLTWMVRPSATPCPEAERAALVGVLTRLLDPRQPPR